MCVVPPRSPSVGACQLKGKTNYLEGFTLDHQRILLMLNSSSEHQPCVSSYSSQQSRYTHTYAHRARHPTNQRQHQSLFSSIKPAGTLGFLTPLQKTKMHRTKLLLLPSVNLCRYQLMASRRPSFLRHPAVATAVTMQTTVTPPHMAQRRTSSSGPRLDPMAFTTLVEMQQRYGFIDQKTHVLNPSTHLTHTYMTALRK